LAEKRLIIVDREEGLTRLMGDFFSQLGSEYVVLSARSILEAIQIISQAPVDLVLSLHERPKEIDGLKLLAKIRRLNVPLRVILLAEDVLEEDRILALSLGCTTFLTKPVSDSKLCELVYDMLQPNQGFAGHVVGMKLEDVIQMFCYRKESTRVTILNERGHGVIFVDDGGIVHAQCDSLEGVEAFYEILGWDSGEFLSQVCFRVPPRSVFMDWQGLLMEGMRQRDEIRHALGPIVEVDGSLSGQAVAGNGGGSRAARNLVTQRVIEESAKRIMIVDDSRFIRKIVQEIVQSDPGLIVAGYATNGQEALSRIEELKPDLILLDWDMPVMKGGTTLMHIMIRSPCPVVVLSGFVGGVGANPFDLLCFGGVDFLRKPQNNWRLDGRADDLVRRIKAACGIKFERIRRVKVPAPFSQVPETERGHAPAGFLSVFASSIGGCADLIRVIPSLPPSMRSAVVVFHDMQQQSIGAFVDYLDRRSRIPVRSLESGAPLMEGVCYVHPAAVPLELVREGLVLSAKVLPDLPQTRALDGFLISAAGLLGRDLAAVVLSGGPESGIDGLRAVKQAAGTILSQDPMSCTDPRLAESALQENIVDCTCPADALAEALLKQIR